MKLFKALFISFFILSPALLYSQTEVVSIYFSPIYENYSSNYLNGISCGRGNAGIADNDGLSSIYLNPASLNISKNYAINFQYTARTNQKFDSPFSSDFSLRQNWLFSQSLSFGLQVNRQFQCGLSYSNPASFVVWLGTSTAPDGTQYNDYSRIETHSIRLPLTYKTGMWSFGMSIYYNYYVEDFHGLISTINNPDGYVGDVVTSIGRFNVQFGIIFTPARSFSIGAEFTPGFKSVINEHSVIGVTPLDIIARYPAKGGIGLKYDIPDSKVKLYLDYNYENLGAIDGYKDKHNLNGGLDYLLSKKLTLRGGFFTFLTRSENTSQITYIIPASDYDQLFFTLGGTYRFKNSDITAAILHSHPIGGRLTNTYLNVGYNINF